MTGPIEEHVLTEYQALLAGRGCVDLASWTQLEFSGSDRLTFVHNLCTNDIKSLSTGETREAFITNVHGKTIGHGWFHSRPDSLILTTAPRQADVLINHFEKYRIREKVTIVDQTSVWSRWLVTGELPDEISEFTFPWHDVAAHVLTGPAGRSVIGGKQECSMSAFEIARVEARLPVFGIDITDANLPQELNRNEQAINFTKGCYLGQETVARLDALGHVNRTLCLLQLEKGIEPQAGMTLEADGKVITPCASAIWSP